jgi:hypothetical protein
MIAICRSAHRVTVPASSVALTGHASQANGMMIDKISSNAEPFIISRERLAGRVDVDRRRQAPGYLLPADA